MTDPVNKVFGVFRDDIVVTKVSSTPLFHLKNTTNELICKMLFYSVVCRKKKGLS